MIMIPKRRLMTREQPEVAHAGLQQAMRIRSFKKATPLRTISSAPRRGRLIAKSSIEGVPHGAINAIVIARQIRVIHEQGLVEIYFCPSCDYRVLEQTISNTEDKDYPAIENTYISSGCAPQQDGLYDLRMRVSINGSVHLHVERFDRHISHREFASA